MARESALCNSRVVAVSIDEHMPMIVTMEQIRVTRVTPRPHFRRHSTLTQLSILMLYLVPGKTQRMVQPAMNAFLSRSYFRNPVENLQTAPGAAVSSAISRLSP